MRRGADGTATWEGENRTTTYSWTIAPAGHLSAHRREFAASPNGTFTEHARFEPQQDVPIITLPPEGTELDLDRFGVWPDLPRPTATAS